MLTPRRQSLKALGIAFTSAGLGAAAGAESLAPPTAHTLDALTRRLAAAPKRRDFKTLPMILDNSNQWDAEALDAVLHYTGGPKQSWDNTDISGPWLNVMRNAMNAQVWSFGHPNFLCVSATHGSAQLALYDDEMWDKYGLAKQAGPNITRNSFVEMPATANHDAKNFQEPNGPFSPRSNSIVALQQRGAVFLACHNAVWELANRLAAAGSNPDKLPVDGIAADLRNHTIPGVVMTPGAVGSLVELAKAGFAYAR